MAKNELAEIEENEVKFKPNWFGLKMMLGGKFKNKISVEDVKQYIYDEMSMNTKLQRKVFALENKLHKIKEWEDKYNLSCMTLGEFKERLKAKDQDLKKAQQELNTLRNKVKDLKTEVGGTKVLIKQLEKTNSSLTKEIEKLKSQLEEKEKPKKTTRKKANNEI